MSDGVDDLARRSARRLAAQLDIEVEGPVEQAIAGSRPGQYVDPGTIALGALIVSIANLVWTMFNDLRNDHKQSSNDTIARQVRVKVQVPVRRPRLSGHHQGFGRSHKTRSGPGGARQQDGRGGRQRCSGQHRRQGA